MGLGRVRGAILFPFVLLCPPLITVCPYDKLCVFQALLASVAGDEVAGRFDGKFILITIRMGNLYDDVVFC